MQDELWIIDVSQAVDLDHPRALDFLKEDAAHINAFFRRAGIAVLTTRQLFDFAVDPSINESNLHEAVETLQQLAVRCSCIPCILKSCLTKHTCILCLWYMLQICDGSQLFFHHLVVTHSMRVSMVKHQQAFLQSNIWECGGKIV